jgi:hypothetical protein
MADIYLICEGSTDGLDRAVLDRIIAKKLGKRISIEAAGGDSNLRSVAAYFEIRYSAHAYSIEDRNYRSPDEVETSWAKPDGKRFIWRRHEIENYLLDPRVIADAVDSLRTTTQATWLSALPQTPDQVEQVLQRLAQEMIEQHIGWLTYHRLEEELRKTITAQIQGPKPRLQPPTGARYPGRAEWLDHLQAECSRIKSECAAFAGTSVFEEPSVTALYDELLAEISQPDFYSSGRYLVDMAGKELMSALSQQVVPRLSRSDLHTELITALERRYAPGFFTPDDFSELANRLV